jgi:hypothetical protein
MNEKYQYRMNHPSFYFPCGRFIRQMSKLSPAVSAIPTTNPRTIPAFSVKK